ncbi:hypothetical protein [Thermochromatium tepidum]|uniref:Uncharacterized protein n=1 Tax=Thermochromatium tepidum ATCC 43061 TaxID=316276 RepID=A0A6I6E3N7_THETI|nr:hypothetical protein [Thermochromatium tepidum]QGU32372.1 hypothetical protein E6P07_04820 [Thermochromatium tepidum ATCC 43061]
MLFVWILSVYWLGLSLESQAADWSARLSDGSRVEVDAATRRAWRLDGAQRTPLWDGVHRLDDGSVVIVRDGVAVPNPEMLETWNEAPPHRAREPKQDTAPCLELVSRVCGEGGRSDCAGSEPCRLARELLEMSKEPLPLEDEIQAESSIGAQCREAMANPFFTPCR